MFKYRIIIFVVSVLVSAYVIFSSFSLELNVWRLFWYSNTIGPILALFLYVVITSLFTFFISDRIFARWITFAIVWMIMAVSAIAISPIYSPYIFGGPTKESVSIWMGALFVIISLTMFAVMTWRERRHV